MKKLSICIPQYKETDEIIKPLLDSIALQQSVDFNDIEIIIVNDGSDVKLTNSFLKSYNYEIKYLQMEHKGVSAARNFAMDNASGEYIMFCDADDLFCNVCGLYIIFREMNIKGGFDTFVSVFMEETRDKNGDIKYINREHDLTFVHGKVHRKKYLVNNNIRWNENLTIHEDSYFNCLCQKMLSDEERGRYCSTPFYLWKWRDESVCRHDPLYLNKTYINMFESNTALINEFIDRGKMKDAQFFVVSMVYDAYYSFNCDRWWEGEGKDYLEKTEKRFKQYWDEFKDLFNGVSKENQIKILSGLRNRFFQEGLMLERITFTDWIKHIEELNT